MNICQMSNNINPSTPPSPNAAGTIAATSETNQHQVTDNQRVPERTQSDKPPGEVPQEEQQQQDQQQQQQHPSPKLQVDSESLKVRIKTNTLNNYLSNNNNTTTTNNNNSIKSPNKDESRANNNSIAPKITTNNKSDNEGLENKTNNTTNKLCKGKTNKANNGGNSSAIGGKASNSNNLSENSPTETEDIETPVISMNNHGGGSASSAENGKVSAQPPPPPHLPQPTTQAQPNPQSVQSRSQQLQPSPLAPPPPPPQPTQQQKQVQPIPQLPLPSVAQPPSNQSKKTTTSPTAQAEPKRKATRTRKQPASSNKGANAPDTNPKPEPKRTKKAKPSAENTNKAKTTTLPSTQSTLPTQATTSSTIDNKTAASVQQSPTVPPTKKRKSRAASINSTTVANTNETTKTTVSPPKRARKKKNDQAKSATDNNNNPPPLTSTNISIPPLNVPNPQLLSVAPNIPLGSNPMISSAPLPSLQQPNLNRQMPGLNPMDAQDPSKYISLTISPYPNYDYSNAASLTRPGLQRLFTSSSSVEIGHSNSHSDELARAFEELRDNTWSHLSKNILEQAQQFDIPTMIGTLYTLKSENEKLMGRVRELTQKREQLIAMNARLELPHLMLTQHLNQTSPNFSSVVATLTNSPKSIPNSSPSPAMNKSPIVPGGTYNHMPPANSLGPPGFIDRSSPLVGLQTPHSGVNSLKSSAISTPSPPTGALMAHGANNRASLMTVNNPPYMSNVHALNQLGGPNPPSSYYPRQ